MTLATRLRQLADALPEGAAVTLTREQLLAMLEAAGEVRDEEVKPIGRDLTLAEVGELYNRRPNTVRDWIKSKGLRAYLDATGQYRVTPAALEEWQEAQRKAKAAPKKKTTETAAPVDLGAWRQVRRKAG